METIILIMNLDPGKVNKYGLGVYLIEGVYLVNNLGVFPAGS